MNPALLLANPRHLEQSPLPLEAFESSSVGEQPQAFRKQPADPCARRLVLTPLTAGRGLLNWKRLTMESAGLSSTSVRSLSQTWPQCPKQSLERGGSWVYLLGLFVLSGTLGTDRQNRGWYCFCIASGRYEELSRSNEDS